MIYLSDHQTIAFQCPKQPLLNQLYFQLNFLIFIYASVIIGRDKRSLCWGGRWRPINLLTRLFHPSCFVKKRESVGNTRFLPHVQCTCKCRFPTPKQIWVSKYLSGVPVNRGGGGGGGGGGGILLGIVGGGVLPSSPNPEPISDQKMYFSSPVFRPDL